MPSSSAPKSKNQKKIIQSRSRSRPRPCVDRLSNERMLLTLPLCRDPWTYGKKQKYVPSSDHRLYQAAHAEILLDDDVCGRISTCVLKEGFDKRKLAFQHTVHSRHDEADLHGIGGACKVCVDLLGLVLVQRDEAVEDVVACRSVVRTAWSKVSTTVISRMNVDNKKPCVSFKKC